MRTLVIAGEYPWPVDSGPRTRLTTTLRGLRRCGHSAAFKADEAQFPQLAEAMAFIRRL